jgi:hypothetical protein
MRTRVALLLENQFIIVIMLSGFAISGCGTTMHLPSHWPDQRISVDGKNIEWDRTYLIDDNKLVIGFVNDSSFVYMLLATNDRPLAMSMRRGLTVWFDSHGGDDRTFGIHYPMGGGFSQGGHSSEGENNELALEPADQLIIPSTELEILGPGKEDRHRMQIMETGGIQAKYTLNGNSFVYEMRVPFTQGDQFPFAIHANVGNTIGLGLETSRGREPRKAEKDRPEGGVSDASENEGERGDYGGSGMRGGGRGGERGGFGQRGTRESSGPLSVWMKVKLVAKDTLSN